MTDYPVIYWVVVAIIAGVVGTVLIGIGYLLGLKVAARRVATVREEMARARVGRAPMCGYEKRYDDLASWARQTGGV